MRERDPYGAALAVSKARARRGPRRHYWREAVIASAITIGLVVLLFVAMAATR